MLRRSHLLRPRLDKEPIIAIVSIALLCTVYIFVLDRNDEICENSYNWTSQLPNLSSLITGAIVLSSPSCSSLPVFLMIIVCSAAPNFSARQSIRQTWGKSNRLGQKVQVFFLIGRSSDFLADSFVFEENQEYRDIIHYNFSDTYFNLTLKSALMLRFLKESCWKPTFLMKVDDDTFVNVGNLEKHLSSLTGPHHIFGCLIENAFPDKDRCSKWYVPDKLYPERPYPNYLSGSAYVISYEVADLLYKNALFSPFFPFEDIFITGICAAASELTPKNHDGFSYRRPHIESCYLRRIVTGHRVTPEEQFTIMDKIGNSYIKCS